MIGLDKRGLLDGASGAQDKREGAIGAIETIGAYNSYWYGGYYC